MTGLPAAGWARTRALGFDLLLAGTLTLVLGLGSISTVEPARRTMLAVAGVLGAAQVVPLIWRRVNPTAVFAVCSAAAVVQWSIGMRLLPANVGLLFALYAVALYGPLWANRAGLAVGLIGVPMALGRYYADAPIRNLVTVGAAMTAVVFGVWAIAERRRTNALYVAQLEERAAQLERDRDREAKLAVSAERTRIAREIHDVVAHGLSIMIVQADGGLYAADARPDQAKKALATIGDTGRGALTEMRQLLGLLRQDEAGPGDHQPRPQPGVSQIPELVENVREAGLSVQLTVIGTPRELPALLGLTAYRIVQEGLTNALKHAGPGATANVDLAYGNEDLIVTVADDGRGAAAADGDGAGQGLVGMRQRVSISGGTVRAGPRPGGGYVVTARLPYEPTTQPTEPQPDLPTDRTHPPQDQTHPPHEPPTAQATEQRVEQAGAGPNEQTTDSAVPTTGAR